MTVELPVFYYLDNFRHVLEHVSGLYENLLTVDEQSFCHRFEHLSRPAQGLLVRLLNRKGELFRSDRVSYAELGDLSRLAEELSAAGLLQIWSPGQLAALPSSLWLPLFTRPELQRWAQPALQQLGLKPAACKTLRREALEEHVITFLSRAELVVDRLATEDCWQLATVALSTLTTLRLLYFGNLQQGFTDFVLADLGVAPFENYELNRAGRLFDCREVLDAHRQFYCLYPEDDWLSSASAEDLLGCLAALPEPVDKVLARRLDRLKLKVARQLERLGNDECAIALYQTCDGYPARERLIRLLVKRGEEQRALDLCAEAWQQPVSDDEQQFLLSFMPRLIKRLQKQLPGLMLPEWFLLPESPQEWFLTLPADWVPGAASVEDRCLQDLLSAADNDWSEGWYVENGLITAVAGLLYWPLIFAPVPGAFFHRCQYRPDDLYEAEFLVLRAEFRHSIEQSLDDGSWRQQVLDRAASKYGLQNPLVNWGFVDYGLANGCIERALEVIPVAHWRALFEFLWADLRNHRSGLPDLLVVSDSGDYCLVEVKGPGDQLQANQKSWLAAFARATIPAAVLYARPLPE